MGNRLANHEPHDREVLLSAPAFAVVHRTGGGRKGGDKEVEGVGGGGGGEAEHVEVVRHQLYAKGSGDDLTLALKIATQE